MTNDQLLAAPGKILHFPTVLGAVVPVYNIPGVSSRAEVHRPGARRHLPRQDHQVERSRDREAEPRRQPAGDRHHGRASLRRLGHDLHLGGLPGEGLARVEDRRSAWPPSVNWPAGVGGKGNEGVAGPGEADAGSIGYVELIYALQNKISYGSVQNTAGEFVKATVESVTAAAAAAAEKMPTDFRVSITNAAGQGRLSRSRRSPGCCSTRTRRTRRRRRSMVDFMKWALTDGQKFCAELGYAPLPEAVVEARDGGAGEDQDLVERHSMCAQCTCPTRSRLQARHGRCSRSSSWSSSSRHRRSS